MYLCGHHPARGHERTVRGTARSGTHRAAEEVAQEALVRIWERWEQIGGLEDPAGYLHRTAFNVFRSRRRRAMVALRKTLRHEEPDDVVEAAEARIEVARAIAELTPMQRAAIVLTDLLGYSSDEAAGILHMKAGAVRTLASRGRDKMRSEVGEVDA